MMPARRWIRFFACIVVASGVWATASASADTFIGQFRSSVVLVETIRGRGSAGVLQTEPRGTAFWVGSPERPVLVSNKHVFAGVRRVALRVFSPESSRSVVIVIDLVTEAGDTLWAGHPKPQTDVAAWPWRAYQPETPGVPHVRTVQWSLFASDADVVEGDRVFCLGYPLGLRTTTNPYALVRTGSIALRPADDFLLTARGDTVGHAIYLMDMVSVGGSSGSPVFLEPGVSRPYRDTGHVIRGTGTALVGIVSGHVVDFEPIVVEQTKAFALGNAGLAIVHAAADIKLTAELALGIP